MYTTLLMYQYITIPDPQAIRTWYKNISHHYKAKGRTIIAKEGFNSTIEILTSDVPDVIAEIHNNPLFKNMHIKKSTSNGDTFPKCSIKIRDEIVGTKFPKHIDPQVRTATHISPTELHKMFQEEKDFVVVDMRNEYELASGFFKHTVNPHLNHARDLPKAIPTLNQYRNKKIVTVCTGGVRCEKMSAYLLDQGFTEVCQLDGGIHTYLEEYPHGYFSGSLYTFDKRKVMHTTSTHDVVGECTKCKQSTERYIDCANDECHTHVLMCETCAPHAPAFCSYTCRKNTKRFTLELTRR
ncbi:MAG: rhodanese-related sulfurtransferase [Alphaproteobacteria bacterium]|nr:rhodanese-related sulfurtransferase [Alphaproteobacteria bacterium]